MLKALNLTYLSQITSLELAYGYNLLTNVFPYKRKYEINIQVCRQISDEIFSLSFYLFIAERQSKGTL